MAQYQGNSGTVTLPDGIVADISQWTLAADVDEQHYAIFGEGNKRVAQGAAGYSGTLTGKLIDGSGPLPVSTTVDPAGFTGTLALTVDGTEGYTGAAMFSNVTLSRGTDGTQEFTASFKYSGAVTPSGYA